MNETGVMHRGTFAILLTIMLLLAGYEEVGVVMRRVPCRGRMGRLRRVGMQRRRCWQAATG